MDRLATATLKRGSAALAAEFADVRVPLADAIAVFATHSLPRFLAMTRAIAMERLWDPAAAAGLIARRHREASLWRSGFVALQLE